MSRYHDAGPGPSERREQRTYEQKVLRKRSEYSIVVPRLPWLEKDEDEDVREELEEQENETNE